MSRYMTQYSAADLLKKLGDERLALAPDIADFILTQQQEKELPLYLRSLIGIGAFIGSLCFIGSLFVSDLINFNNEQELIIWGPVFVAGSMALLRLGKHGNTAKHSFFLQASFAVMAVGKTLFVFGVGELLSSGWGVTLALLIITCVTYPFYRMSIDRFLSSFAVLYSILVNITEDYDIKGCRELFLNGFFLLQFVSAALLLTYGKIKRDFIPLSYALVFSLCASVLFLASHSKFGYWKQEELINTGFINSIVTGGLIALIGWAAGGLERLKNQALILAAVGVMLLGLVSAPGIILAISLMVLGYAKHEQLLIVVGALLTPVFLFLFYYNLDMSLMQKSGVLVSSGLVLLAGRLYMQHKGWNEDGGVCEKT